MDGWINDYVEFDVLINLIIDLEMLNSYNTCFYLSIDFVIHLLLLLIQQQLLIHLLLHLLLLPTRHLSDTHVFDFSTSTWSMLITEGPVPSPRDSHVAVIFGRW